MSLAIALGLLAGILCVLPLVVPLHPLHDTVPPEALADPDKPVRSSRREQRSLQGRWSGRDGIRPPPRVRGEHVFVAGGPERVLSVGEHRRVRPTWAGANPYAAESQIALVLRRMVELGIEKAILVGHSAGGGIALRTALTHPEKFAALVLISPATGGGGPFPAWLRPVLATPQARRLGPLLVRRIRTQGPDILRQSWHDPSIFPPEVTAGYEKPLGAQDCDRALWEVTLAAHPTEVASRLGEISCSTLVVTENDDRIVPAERSRDLADRIPGAEYTVLLSCGHLPHEERPREFLDAVRTLLSIHHLISAARSPADGP